MPGSYQLRYRDAPCAHARPGAAPAGESATREVLRAAAADLRHHQGFLAAVARSLDESELPPSDAELAALAARQSLAVAGLAAVLEQALV
jgi:hypothetical protein